jgi:hypothetical protein
MVPENAFSLILTEVEPNNNLNLAATSEKQLHHVLDGFRTLLGNFIWVLNFLFISLSLG